MTDSSSPRPLIEDSTTRDVLEALRIVVLDVDAKGNRRLLSPLPEWYRAVWTREGTGPLDSPADHPFFSNFLIDANDFWDSEGENRLASGPWVEETADGSTLNLEALAFKQGPRRLLVLKRLGSDFRERLELLQKARENSLSHERLTREIQQKEILLHCIVHDLAGPLTGISGSLSLLRKEPLSEAGERRLSIGQRATDQLNDLIREILDVFAAEVEGLSSFSGATISLSDLLLCAEQVLETLAPTATLRDIELNLSCAPGVSPSFQVVAEADRLERVLYNLVQNALRHAPAGSPVRVTVGPGDSGLRIAVKDEGPGVAPDLRPKLFQKLLRGEGKRGKAGLGLYFCRITVERWGGKIGYTTGTPGGAVFWFVLPESSPPSSTDTTPGREKATDGRLDNTDR